MATTYNAGIVTAYGAAVRGGYTGTYEQYCEEQAHIGTNAQRAESAADRAEAAAERVSGGITVVDTVAEMVDTNSVYLYNGTQTGYTAGHWYYYNTGTSAWTDGGQYTGWETVDTALENFLEENAQEMGTLTVVVGSTTYTYNGSVNVSIALPTYNGGVS